jgi:Fur family ferric uptake transcriptional regulator
MTVLHHDWVSDTEQALAQAGYRRGGARRGVLDLLNDQACALSALEIEDRLRAGERSVSRASIYRILEELERLGAIQRVDIGQGIVRYEPVRADRNHHHHLVCDQCGALQPFSDPELERAIKRLSQRVPLAVSDHEVVLHGSCADCEPRALSAAISDHGHG